MKFVRTFLCLSAISILPGQTPPPQRPPTNQPTVTMSVEEPNSKPMPVVPPDRVVVTVGDVSLTAAQFDQIVEALPEQYRAAARGAGRKQFADNIIRVLVLSQEGRKRKLNENSAFQTQTMFLIANTLAGLTFQQISKELPLDEAAVRKLYEEHKPEYEQVHARHILIRMQGSPTPVKPGQKELTEDEALAKAVDLRKKLVAGADFAALAAAESDDPGSALKGGDLGTFVKGRMVPSFDEAAFSLKPGELSQPVKSQRGIHLIRVESHDFKTLDEVRPELERRLRPDAANKVMEDLQKKATVVLDPEFFNLAKK